MAIRWYVALGLVVSLALAGCVPDQAQNQTSRPVTAAPAALPAPPSQAALSSRVPTEPILFDKLAIAISTGTKIGVCDGCRECTCAGEHDIYWNSGPARINPEDFRGAFFEPLAKMGYKVVGDPRLLFESEEQRASARYLIGAQITHLDVWANYRNVVWNPNSVRGWAQLRVNWQVYSLRERRVIYQVSTDGLSRLDRKGSDLVIRPMILAAFGKAAEALAQNVGLRYAVSVRADTLQPREAVEGAPVMEIPNYARLQGPISGRAPGVLGATVTILQATGHGSGFFISDDGLILTNQHVVGDADQITVRLPGGVELPGKVLRRHIGRDVALVKVEVNRIRPLPINRTTPGVGSEVFAIGTPSHPSLPGSLTRGIVSAMRTVAQAGVDYPMIQSDVAIQGGNSGGPLLDASGNVIGIAVSGIGPGQMNAGLNFFIPIEDALTYLNVRLGQPSELRF